MEVMNDDNHDETPLLCARCSSELTPGTGDFYVVRIEALADPTPPAFSEEDMEHDPRAEIERLIQQMRICRSRSCSIRFIDGSSFICAARATASGSRTQ